MKIEFAKPWVAVLPLPRSTPAALEPRKYHGSGYEILLQGFHWASHAGVADPAAHHHKSWYRIMAENAPAIAAAGFSWVWFPPPSDSLAPQGYIPRRWNVFDTAYGTEAELRAAIAALEPVRALADVVLNHRVGVATAGADFADPPFPDNRAAICRDDESGVGTGNHDTGERHPAGRDLDHTNPDVRATIVSYLRRLKNLGFGGWRYDLVKGYHGRYVAEYNDATTPAFSVGECFESDRQCLCNWLDSAAGKSTTFDFATRFLLYDACRHDDYRRLRSHNAGRAVPGGLIGYWPSRAVTFVDNHDTEYRRDADNHYDHSDTRHFGGSTVDMAYAYILTHPGIPCVFWSHFFDWGQRTRQRITALMRIRRLMGINANSHVEFRDATRHLYAAIIDDRVAVKLGARDWYPGSGWRLVVDGERFAVWARYL